MTERTLKLEVECKKRKLEEAQDAYDRALSAWEEHPKIKKQKKEEHEAKIQEQVEEWSEHVEKLDPEAAEWLRTKAAALLGRTVQFHTEFREVVDNMGSNIRVATLTSRDSGLELSIEHEHLFDSFDCSNSDDLPRVLVVQAKKKREWKTKQVEGKLGQLALVLVVFADVISDWKQEGDTDDEEHVDSDTDSSSSED